MANNNMKNWLKNFFLVFILLLLVSSLFSLTDEDRFAKIEEISLSELARQIINEKIESIIIEGNELTITTKDNAQKKALKEKDISLTTSLKNFGASEKQLRQIDIREKNPSGLLVFTTTFLPIILPFLLIGAFVWFMFKQAKKGQSQVFSFGRTKAQLFHAQRGKKKITFDDIGGLTEVKTELKEIVDFLKYPKKFLNMGAKIPCGVLLVGPPGTGKTLIARAVANEAGVPFFSISGSEFVEMFVGVGAARVRDTFKLAKRQAPAILFIDELDAIGRHRGAGLGGGHDEREQTLNQILVEMDGFNNQTSVIIIAATNRPDILDPALLRPGRFDRRVILEYADIKDREKVLKIHAGNKPLDKKVNLKIVAERTPGFSGADLENLLNEAAILAARKNSKKISQQHILESIEKVLLGPERKSKILSKKEKEISAYHEAGHALVAAKSLNADPIHKISIISRGMVAGYTLKLPTKDKHFHSKSEFLTDLSVLLGGYVAEKLTFNEITTGASSDLQKATNLARELITKYGMSEKMGPVTFGKREEMIFIGKEIHESRNYSEKIAARIDEEISKFIKNAYKNAEEILKKNKTVLKKIAQVLIKKEIIEREEFEKLVGKKASK
jgi:cell division protease FtsH